ncbi:MAG: phosphoribosylanthranilate isomerase [Hyphomicrobiales bacterium]|nr:phosphoribosylanthranilate isomerase [Hyphomicrobiales bacterium]
MTLEIKICGLNSDEAVDAALEAGADLIAFNFFPKSPRSVSLDAAVRLAGPARGRAAIVALTVDPDDALVDAIAARLKPDLIQLHGHESPARCAEIRARTGRAVMKAIPVADAADLAVVPAYVAVCDRILFDAKPPKTPDALPGGNGLSFDWRLVRDLDPGRPVMLSGGLTPETVAEAIAVTGVAAVDVASGVESAPGRKDPARIRAFIDNAREADRRRTTEPGPKP